LSALRFQPTEFDSSPPTEASGFRALKITFVDDIGALCETRGVNANEVMWVFLIDRKLNILEAYLRHSVVFSVSCLLRIFVYRARFPGHSTELSFRLADTRMANSRACMLQKIYRGH